VDDETDEDIDEEADDLVQIEELIVHLLLVDIEV
jgi:hypothetical protein